MIEEPGVTKDCKTSFCVTKLPLSDLKEKRFILVLFAAVLSPPLRLWRYPRDLLAVFLSAGGNMKRPPPVAPLRLRICVVGSILVAMLTDAKVASMSPSPSPISSVWNLSVPLPPSSIARPPIAVQIIVQTQHHHYHKEMILAVVLASVAVVAIASSTFCAWIVWQRSRQTLGSEDLESSDAGRGLPFGTILGRYNSFKLSKKELITLIDYASLESATNKFNESNFLGEGGFAFVYKACFNGEVFAAVKKLSGGGQDCEKEFENELDLLGRIRHPNIVSLLGYCVHGEERFIVYELMENGSLESQLHGPSHGSALTWNIRIKIALDIARGLEYLHEHCNPPIIHRDLKSSNILLGSDFNAKISDFGLAVPVGYHNRSSLKLSGTVGYVAPEYLLDGKLTEKSDVYAFGVVLLELLMGRKPVEKTAPSQCQSLVTWAMPQLTDRSKLPNIVDPVIMNTMDLKHLYQVAAVAVLCVQREPSYRPLITDVLHSLIPLVPVELGGTLRVSEPLLSVSQKSSGH
ncbi:putative receptor-like protein kinase [Canna indica]|uniref:Receptor-like protein kinase n=1 Tax=Canna indica TaxID=4628 RepID=A0AAQ3L060_9LILI|nr:putative receptor-like protein kinase [Canna indica]